MMTDINNRVQKVNELIQFIASQGRQFFNRGEKGVDSFLCINDIPVFRDAHTQQYNVFLHNTGKLSRANKVGKTIIKNIIASENIEQAIDTVSRERDIPRDNLILGIALCNNEHYNKGFCHGGSLKALCDDLSDYIISGTPLNFIPALNNWGYPAESVTAIKEKANDLGIRASKFDLKDVEDMKIETVYGTHKVVGHLPDGQKVSVVSRDTSMPYMENMLKKACEQKEEQLNAQEENQPAPKM